MKFTPDGVKYQRDADLPSIRDTLEPSESIANDPKIGLEAKRENDRRKAEESYANLELDRQLRSCAREANFSKLADWMHYLGIPRRDRDVLAKIYGFQAPSEQEQFCRMSLSTLGKVLHIDRANVQKILKNLLDSGLVLKESNGPRKPATYRVNEKKCMIVAVANGYEQSGLPLTRKQAMAILDEKAEETR